MATESILFCPSCKGRLYNKDWKNIHLDVCIKGCHGIWFDYNELQAVEKSDNLDNIDKEFEGTCQKQTCVKTALHSDSDRLCPKDKQVMQRYEWNIGSGIVMDTCPACQGIWLDVGELECFVSYVQSFRKNPPEASPDIKAKIEMVNQQTAKEYESILDNSVSAVIKWDLGYLDDILKLIVKNLIK